MFNVSVIFANTLKLFNSISVIELVGTENKGYFLALTVFLGAGFAAIFGPLFGFFSDRCKIPSRRRLFIFCGVILDCIGLFLMGITNDISTFIVSYVFVAGAVTFAAAPFAGLIADIAKQQQDNAQTKLISGIISSMGLIGIIIGSSLGLVSSFSKGDSLLIGFLILMPLMLFGMLITVVSTPEPSGLPSNNAAHETSESHRESSNIASVKVDRNNLVINGTSATAVNLIEDGHEQEETFTRLSKSIFRYVLCFDKLDFILYVGSHFCIQTSAETLRNFLLFYLMDNFNFPLKIFGHDDTTGIELIDSSSAAAILLLISSFGSLLSSLLLSKLMSFGYMWVWLIISVLYMTSFAVVLGFLKNIYFILIFSFIYGLGYGGFITIAWSTIIESTNTSKLQGYLLGIWQTCLILATIMSSSVFGVLLGVFQKEIYPIMLVAVIVLFVVGLLISLCARPSYH